MFELIQRTIYEIKNTLTQDEVIRKLLFQDSNNAMSMLAPEPEEVSKYVTTYPVYEFQNKQDLAQNTLINILLDNADVDNGATVNGVLRINVVVNIDRWELIGGKVRSLAICDRIIDLINNKKFSISNPLSFNSIEELIITKQLVGYALIFDITDGNGDIEKY